MKDICKALVSRDQICDLLKIGKDKFYQLVRAGLPVEKRGGSWIGHKDEVEEWFRVSKSRTEKKVKNPS